MAKMRVDKIAKPTATGTDFGRTTFPRLGEQGMERSKVMEKRNNFSCAGKAIALVIGMSALAGASAAEAKTVRFTTQLPQHNFAAQNVQMFADCVSGKTDLEFQIYPSAQLYRDKEVPQAVSSGAIEMGMVTSARFAGTIPAMEIFDVPFATGMRGDLVKMIAPGEKVRVLPARRSEEPESPRSRSDIRRIRGSERRRADTDVWFRAVPRLPARDGERRHDRRRLGQEPQAL